MIKVVYRDKEISIRGHANYADAGKDIVCAAVSSIVITSVNDMMVIDSDSVDYHDDGNIIIIRIIKDNDLVIKLFNNLKELINSLVKDYPKNIKIESEE